MRIHLLRPESVTPIATYLDRGAAAPGAHRAQFDLAAALLYREREYRAMYLWCLDPDPRPRAESPFRPHDLTPAAADILHRALRPGPDVDVIREPVSPDDLFGLKGDVAERLASTLRPIKAHRPGWCSPPSCGTTLPSVLTPSGRGNRRPTLGPRCSASRWREVPPSWGHTRRRWV